MVPGPEASMTSTGRAGSAPWRVPGARLNTSLAGLSQHHLHPTRCPPLAFLVSECLFVALVVADSMQCSILAFHVGLNVQLTSAALQVLMEAVTYWQYFTINTFSLIPLDFGRQNLVAQIPSSNSQYLKLVLYSFYSGHHLHSSFVWTLLHRQEKWLCLKDKYFLWQVSSTL